MPTERGAFRIAGRRLSWWLWAGGYGPGLWCLALGVFFCFGYFTYQWPGANPVRMAIGRGCLLINTDWPRGRVRWYLGIMVDEAGQPEPGAVFVWTSPFGASSPDWIPEAVGGHLKVPLLPTSAVLLVIAAGARWLIDRRPLKGHCRKCRYNLDGLTCERCPECGAPI